MRLIASALLLVQAGAVAVAQTPQPTTAPSAANATRDTTRRAPRPVRRRPVTPELERSAFADARARTLLERAREARITQDAALRAYQARTYQRLSVGLGVRRLGERLLLRTENAARVAWTRESGVWIEPTGRRAAFPMMKEAEVSMDLSAVTPIPYFPGRETLWFPAAHMGIAKTEVNENDMLHPLATGAEAYYRYEVGDSLTFVLPDGQRIALRELRITARRPQWRAFVGSFWFDVDRGSLVRAAYRMSAEMDIWSVVSEEERREIEEGIEKARDDGPPFLAKAMLSPLRANLSAITVEYGLHEGRFWLPKLHVAEGEAQAGFLRVPVKFEERFRYDAVNADLRLPPIPTTADAGFAAGDTSLSGHLLIGDASKRPQGDTSLAARTARDDSLVRRYVFGADSLRAVADSARAKGDTARARELIERAERRAAAARQVARRRDACVRDSSHVAAIATRYDGAVRVAIRMPCDTTRLANSQELPGSIYGSGEKIFGTEDRDELLKSLDLSLQPGWGPQPVTFHTGLDLLRYNRIEGLSVGASATSVLGFGYTAHAVGRIGTGDWMPHGELSLTRSNGRTDLRLVAFHRLGVANDDWGSPLSFGASVANALYARDEGFYYRTGGAELSGSRDAPGPLGGATLSWRLFAERQRTAGREPNTQVSLANGIGSARFETNIDAVPLTAVGVSSELARSFGADPLGLRLFARTRTEGAFTDRADSIGRSSYGRVVFDATLSRGLGRLAAAVTGAAGTSAGDLPPQRAFYVGGLQTVRGQFAYADSLRGAGRVGDAFWLARTELGLGLVSMRPALFYDIGWAGRRTDFTRPGRPLSGAGAGVSFLDGLVRFDVSRGIAPEKRWRADLYLGARF